MERLKLKGGETLLLELTDDGVLERRAAAIPPIRMYTDERIREFEAETAIDDKTRARVKDHLRSLSMSRLHANDPIR